MSKLFIVDSDFLISLLKEDDINHKQVLDICEMLIKAEARVMYPVSAIVEAATALSRRYGLPEMARILLEKYQNSEIEVVDVNRNQFIESIQYFDPKASKGHTPFDCLILSIAKDKKADVILSFDGFYKDKGFKTARDY